jgi:HlyD family secretion protein
MLAVLAQRRTWFAVAVIGGLLLMALWPDTLDVDVAQVTRGALVVTIDEEGRTRVRDRFVVSSPVTGRVLRIALEPGDRVARGAVLARVRPEAPALLDARTRAEAEAAADGARAALGRARAEEERAAAALAQAERELARSRRLVDAGVLPAQEADLRGTDAQLAREALEAAAFAVRAVAAELARVDARLAPVPRRPAGAPVAVTAPVDGIVLRRLRESESLVPAGEPLVEIGDLAELEIVVDLLSTDAARIREGARAEIDLGGQALTADALVRRIEPSGFTKLSALGVEEQRVNVILDMPGPAGGEDVALGDAYRVDVRIVVWEAADVVRVPTSALVREGEQWAVFVVDGGRARRTLVEIGRQNGRDAEVLAGPAAGARVVIHPGDALRDGSRVREEELAS